MGKEKKEKKSAKGVIVFILAAAVMIGGIIFAMSLSGQKKEQEDIPAAQDDGQEQGPDDQQISPQPAASKVPILGNQDEAIGYDGPGTVRDSGIDTGKDIGYNRLGNLDDDTASGVQPIAVYETLSGYLKGSMLENADNIAITVEGKTKNEDKFISVRHTASFTKTMSHILLVYDTAEGKNKREAYTDGKRVFLEHDGTWNAQVAEGYIPIDGKRFTSSLLAALSDKNISKFAHKIETEEESDAPIEGTTVLTFILDAAGASDLFTQIESTLSGSQTEVNVSGSLNAEMRLDRWGAIETLALSGPVLIKEDQTETDQYIIRFSDIGGVEPIYVPGTEPTPELTPEPTPSPEPEPTDPEGGNGGGGNKPEKDPKPAKLTEARKTYSADGKTNVICNPITLPVYDGKNAFELAPGITATLITVEPGMSINDPDLFAATLDYDMISVNDSAHVRMKIKNSTRLDASATVPMVCYNTTMLQGLSVDEDIENHLVKLNVAAGKEVTVDCLFKDGYRAFISGELVRMGMCFETTVGSMIYNLAVDARLIDKDIIDKDGNFLLASKAGEHAGLSMTTEIKGKKTELRADYSHRTDLSPKELTTKIAYLNLTDAYVNIKITNGKVAGKSIGDFMSECLGKNEYYTIFPYSGYEASATIKGGLADSEEAKMGLFVTGTADAQLTIYSEDAYAAVPAGELQDMTFTPSSGSGDTSLDDIVGAIITDTDLLR